MQERTINFHYQEFAHRDELPSKYRELLECAEASLAFSYAPYSKFQVGAAVLLESGAMLGGANQENAAYPLCLCAERTALALAAMQPASRVVALAVTTNPLKGLASPCGACRQVIQEKSQQQQNPIQLLLPHGDGRLLLLPSVEILLPFGFDGAQLP